VIAIVYEFTPTNDPEARARYVRMSRGLPDRPLDK
jgi:hypothetical protein